MKLKLSAVVFAAWTALALAGCSMTEADAVKQVQKDLDAAASAQTDQELQDLVLADAPGGLAGVSAENSGEILAGIRSGRSFTASGAQAAEEGFAVTVDVVPFTAMVTEDEFTQTYKDLCVRAREMGLLPEDMEGDVFREMAAQAFLGLAGQKAVEGEAVQYTAEVSKKKETDADAVSQILGKGVLVTWPDVSADALADTACEILYDFPGTYVGSADLTASVADELDQVFGVKSEGKICMDLYLVLNEDYSMDFHADTEQFAQSTREYYDANLDKWLGSQGVSVDALILGGEFGSREEILDYLMLSAGYDRESGTIPALEETSYSGTWYYEDGAVLIEGKTDRFERREDGSLEAGIDDQMISFVRQ